jgi:hypothetical protein
MRYPGCMGARAPTLVRSDSLPYFRVHGSLPTVERSSVPNRSELEPAHGANENRRAAGCDPLRRPKAGPFPDLKESSGFCLQETDEALLRKVAVVCEDFLNLSLTHRVHRNAIHEAVLFVWTPFIERQSSEERFVRLRNHLDIGAIENFAYRAASQTPGVIAAKTRRQETQSALLRS